MYLAFCIKYTALINDPGSVGFGSNKVELMVMAFSIALRVLRAISAA
jgi:hypothetical protein